MKRIFLTICGLFTFLQVGLCLDTGDSLLNNFIKVKLDKEKHVSGETIHAQQITKYYYEGRNYAPLWISNKELNKQARMLIDTIRATALEGLVPEKYHLGEISKVLEKIGSAKKEVDDSVFADLDLLLTDAFFSIATHFLCSAIDPATFKVRWFVPGTEGSLVDAMEKAVASNRPSDVLKGLLPQNDDYKRLRNALGVFGREAEKTKWPAVPKLSGDKKLTKGDFDERIPFIRERLGLKKVESGDDNKENLFDEVLEGAVIKFQRQHGLLDDGIVGSRTIETMNVSMEDRITQIRTSLDRLRALNFNLNQKKRQKNVLVNIPDFSLKVYKEGKELLVSKVIVGMKKRKTPLLTSEIVYLIFNPKWFVPDKIFFEDKLPLIQKDVSYLQRHRMKIYLKDSLGNEVDPETVDWSFFDRGNIPYRVVQDSGDVNALGHVKFIFPNRYDVYLHDTPQKELFNNVTRTFSSGCVRVEKPVDLAEVLLGDKEGWNREKIEKSMEGGAQQIVTLNEPVSIDISYITAWTNPDGSLQFRNDIYDYDRHYEKEFFGN